MSFRFSTACTALAMVLAPPATAEAVLPTFNANNFSGNPVITNTYFPVVEGQVRSFEGAPADEEFIFAGLGAGPTILGVKTFTVRDRAFEEGRIVEDTFDYYAQDRSGNVWYFGEDVTNYIYDSSGNLIGTNSESSWRAGVNGALPGYIMPTSLQIGFNYFQEHAPADEALDEGTTVAVLDSFTVSGATYEDVLKVLETSELDKKARGTKYYAPGVGLIFEEEGLKPNLKNPVQTFALVSSASSSAQRTRGAFEFRDVPGTRN